MSSHPNLSTAILYILRLRKVPCQACGLPETDVSLKSYTVQDWKNRVTAHIQCRDKRHALGSRSMNLKEILFVHAREPWKTPKGPRLPKGPK